MRIKILGAAAGGGFPQWNCRCEQCAGVRAGTLNAKARTQSSIAITTDDQHWLLINASPDILHQFEKFPEIKQGEGPRDMALSGVLVVDAQLDHSLGLLLLRESKTPLQLYCTDAVFEDLTQHFPVTSILQHYCGVEHQEIPIDGRSFSIGGMPGLRLLAIPLDGKAPPYSRHRQDPRVGDNIALLIEDTQTHQVLFYAPGLENITPALKTMMGESDCVLVDGSFWHNDEMQRAGVGKKLASQMGHLALSGEDGMLAQLSSMEKPRKVLIHINNTNPILNEDSKPHQMLLSAGVEIAADGMEISL